MPMEKLPVARHEEALPYALLHQKESNLARCYIDLRDKLASLEKAATTVAACRLRLSYNESYFGEPQGQLKTQIADLDRLLPVKLS